MSQFNNQNSEIGVQGDHASARHVRFNGSAWSGDLMTLAEELSTLHTELSRRNGKGDHALDLDPVAKAEACARTGDHAKTANYLAKAGEWALKAATSIGTSIAAEAIRSAFS